MLPLAFVAALLTGCASQGEVTANDVQSKEKQAMDATKKLNGGKAPDQGQGGQ